MRKNLVGLKFKDNWDWHCIMKVTSDVDSCFPGIRFGSNETGLSEDGNKGLYNGQHNTKLDKRSVIILYKWLGRFIKRMGWKV